MPEGHPQAELVAGGSGWADGKFHSPPGWPEGAGWRVVDPATGETVQWGPAEDFLLVATTVSNPEDKPSGDLDIALKGMPVPPEE